MNKKVILFSTRFLENEDYLFYDKNYDPHDIISDGYKEYFLSAGNLTEIVSNANNSGLTGYFNFISYSAYIDNLLKKNDNQGEDILTIDDNYETIQQKVEQILGLNVSLLTVNKSFIEKSENTGGIIYSIQEAGNTFKVCIIDKDCKEYDYKLMYNQILKRKDSKWNKGIIFNTDFGKAIDKRTIDRRFKIYKLRTENSKLYSNTSVYAVWCLSAGSSAKAESWYKALYEELKSQLGQEEFHEVLYFLHDGDIDAKKPFDVISYKESKFSFLDEEKKLSIAIFDHSNSPVAKALRTHDVDKAIEMVEDAMEKGGIQSFLYDLMDCISRWTAKDEKGKTGKMEYEELTEKEKLDKFSNVIESKNVVELKYTSKAKNIEGTPVSIIYEDVKRQIESLR